MVALVSLETVKEDLRVDHDADDPMLDLKISAASAMVLNYMHLPHDFYDALEVDSFGDLVLDSNGDTISTGEIEFDSLGDAVNVPDEVQAAVRMLVGILYRDPSGKESEKWERGYLPSPICAILYPLRDPVLA